MGTVTVPYKFTTNLLFFQNFGYLVNVNNVKILVFIVIEKLGTHKRTLAQLVAVQLFTLHYKLCLVKIHLSAVTFYRGESGLSYLVAVASAVRTAK